MRPLRGVQIVSWRHLGVRARGNTARVLWMCARATVLSSRGGPWAQVLLDGLEGLTVTVDGAGKRAGQSIEGVLQTDKGGLRVKASQHGRALTLVAFVGEAGHRVASEQEAKELVFVPAEKKETLAEHETTMSGYGRLKMVDGTPCWVEFDAGDWYKGKVTGFDAASAKYTISFPDGEQVSSRHALFEPEGFFLDTGKDCGMQFAGLVVGGGTPLAGTPAASPLKPGKRGGNDSKGDGSNAPKRRWVAPSKMEKSAGAQLVGRAIRVLWAFDELYHEATVTSYDPNPSARCSSLPSVRPCATVRQPTTYFPPCILRYLTAARYAGTHAETRALCTF